MIQRARKRTLFLVGVAFASIASLASGYLRSNYSREDSLFLPNIAHADTASWSGFSPGDGCGGCSSDASSDGCADSGADSGGDGCCCY